MHLGSSAPGDLSCLAPIQAAKKRGYMIEDFTDVTLIIEDTDGDEEDEEDREDKSLLGFQKG